MNRSGETVSTLPTRDLGIDRRPIAGIPPRYAVPGLRDDSGELVAEHLWREYPGPVAGEVRAADAAAGHAQEHLAPPRGGVRALDEVQPAAL